MFWNYVGKVNNFSCLTCAIPIVKQFSGPSVKVVLVPLWCKDNAIHQFARGAQNRR
jgi:hypothetical protein